MGSRSHWRIASATSAGSAHLKNGLPNQDAVFHALVETSRHQVAIAAVADGAGSATRSDEGSQIAAAAAVNDIACAISKRPATAYKKHLSTSLVRNAVKHAKNAVVRYAKEQNIRSRDLASTLLVAVACDRIIAAGQIGDGAIIAFNTEEETAKTLCAAHKGEHANETTFIVSRTRPHKVASVGICETDGFNAIALISDGLENLALKMPERIPHIPFWRPMLNDLSQSENTGSVSENMLSFINSQRVRERTHDDITMVVAMQRQ